MIYIVTHGPIIEEYYSVDKELNSNNITIINVSNSNLKNSRFKVLNLRDFENYFDLGYWYAESEAIYNIYKNKLYNQYDYVGFLHWDFEFKCENPFISNNVSELIDKLISKKEEFISFSTFSFYEDYIQNIMMDVNYPNQLVGDGLNCWDIIINDYNHFFNENIDLNYMMTKNINLCSSFLCKKSLFEDLMRFYSHIIESKKLEGFDTLHKNRFQGGMMERYIGCYSHRFCFTNIPLFHRFINNTRNSKNDYSRLNFLKRLFDWMKR